VSGIQLPHDAKAGPTKPEVRAVLRQKLALDTESHFVEVGSCTGAVTATAARDAGRVTALERKQGRLDVTRKNLSANGLGENVQLRHAEAPAGLPDEYDVLFLGGSRNYEAILDHAVAAGAERVVMNVARLEVAGEAARAFRDRGLVEEIVQFQVSHGYELAGATSFDADNPVYMLVGRPTDEDGSGEGSEDATDGGDEGTDDRGDEHTNDETDGAGESP
jgi:cobalt-precorrin-6B (C15)-methyltransferase